MASLTYMGLMPPRTASAAIPLVELVSGRNLSSDVHAHRLAFPVLHQLLFPKVPVHELLCELDAVVVEHGRIRLEPAVERHRDGPRTAEDFRVLDRDVVADRIGADRRETLNEMQRFAVI